MSSGLAVGYDATATITGSTGIARYTNELARALEARGVIVRRFAVGRAAVPPGPETRHVRVPLRVARPLWRLSGWPRVERLVAPIDLVHAASLEPPPSRLPIVVTVHDLAALERPDLHPRRSVQDLRRQVASLHRARMVLADSKATANALLRSGIAAERVIVALLGVTPFPEPVDPGLATGSYLLAVGQLMPRKDFHTLLRAFARARVGDARLVLAGPPGIDEASLRAAAQQLGIGERVVFAGPVSDALLAGLYAGAIALCFPSIAEGFGLPLLEAMAAGLPVVASDIDVVDEVCGDAALRFPVHDQDALAAALEEIVRDEAARSSLRVAGRARAAQFTWDRTAELTVQGYERALL